MDAIPISDAATRAWMATYFDATLAALRAGEEVPALEALLKISIPVRKGGFSHSHTNTPQRGYWRSNILAMGMVLLDDRLFELFGLIRAHFGGEGLNFNDFLCDGYRQMWNLWHLVLGLWIHPAGPGGFGREREEPAEEELRAQTDFLIKVMRELRTCDVDPVPVAERFPELLYMIPTGVIYDPNGTFMTPTGVVHYGPHPSTYDPNPLTSVGLEGFYHIYYQPPQRRRLRAAFLALSGASAWDLLHMPIIMMGMCSRSQADILNDVIDNIHEFGIFSTDVFAAIRLRSSPNGLTWKLAHPVQLAYSYSSSAEHDGAGRGFIGGGIEFLRDCGWISDGVVRGQHGEFSALDYYYLPHVMRCHVFSYVLERKTRCDRMTTSEWGKGLLGWEDLRNLVLAFEARRPEAAGGAGE